MWLVTYDLHLNVFQICKCICEQEKKNFLKCMHIGNWVISVSVYVIISSHQPLPPYITLSLHSLYYPIFSTIHVPFRVFVIVFVFERYFFTFVPVVVDCLLFLFFSLLGTTFFFPGGYISIVFKSSSMALQRTIYELLLEAIIIPECTYFHLQRIKTFHF